MSDVDALRPRDPRCCQMDAHFQPRLSSDSIDPTKDVRTHPPMVLLAMALEIKLLAFFQRQQAYLLPCVKVLLYSVRNSAPLFNGGKTFWLVMMSSRWWQSHHHLASSCQRSWEATCHHSYPFALQAVGMATGRVFSGTRPAPPLMGWD